MKPVNFIEVEKTNREIKSIILLLLPAFLLLAFIMFDLFFNVYRNTKTTEDLVSLDEFRTLETKIHDLELEKEETKKKINYYNHLEKEKLKEGEVLETIKLFANNSNDNIFINSFSYNATDLSFIGSSLSSDLLDNFDNQVLRSLNDLILSEVNYENGYYKFVYKGEAKWNFSRT